MTLTAYTLTIEGTDRTSNLQARSLMWKDELNSTDTLSFTLKSDASLGIQVGQAVVFTDSGTTIFSGQVDKAEEVYRHGLTWEGILYEITCVDYGCVFDRRHYAGAFDNKTLGYIVGKILDSMGSEGITRNNVAEGPVIEKASFKHLSVRDCLNELARLTTYKWWVDENKDLHFVERTTEPAPWSIAPGANFRNFRKGRERLQYRNQQIVIGGKIDASPLSVERFTAAAGQQEFFLGDGVQVPGDDGKITARYDEIRSVSAVYVNGAAQTVGVSGEAGKQWYYSVGGRSITTEQTLTAGTTVELVYRGRYNIIGVAVAPLEILARKTIEGGTGIYEGIEIDETIEEYGEARARAQSLLTLHGTMPTIITFQTDTAGLRAGQMIPVQLLDLGIDYQYLIQQVQAKDVDGQYLQYNVRCVGSEVTTWTNFYRGLRNEKARVQAEFMPVVVPVVDTVSMADTLTVTEAAYAPGKVEIDDMGTTRIGFSEVGKDS